MKYNPSGVGEIILENIILDLNGTLAVNGELVSGVPEKISILKNLGFKIFLFTGDQRGNASLLAESLGIEVKKALSSDQKEMLTRELDIERTVAIGNARIDIGTFKPCKLRIATLQSEGIHSEILKHIDIIVPSIIDAFNLLIDPNIFNATMRK